MVKAIDFAVRDSAGALVRGAVAGDAGSNFIQMGIGEEISLNLARESITAYARQGDDLVITLVDGRQIVLDGYFNTMGEPNQLYLSQNGEVVAVELTTAGDGTVYASYGPADSWDKFSTLDDLRFANGDDLALAQGVTDEPAGMAAFAPALLGLGGTGAALLGAALVTTVIGGGGGGGGDSGPRPPTVDEPDSSRTVTTESDDKTLEVSGTGEPGDEVTVTIGDETRTTVIGDDGTWTVTFPETGLPADGTHETVVVFEHDDGTTTTLDGPTFILDLTPPDVAITSGAKSTGDVENAEEYADGVTIGGTGEVGATIVVTIGTFTQTTTVTQGGTWTVTFPTTQVPSGEREIPFTVTATDALGNDNTINDILVIDTIPNPISFNPVTADNTISGAEAASGFTISGSSVSGAVLTVTIQGISQTVTAGPNGAWSMTFPSGQLTGGEYDATITAVSTDAAGNRSTQTHTFRVDTTTSVAFAPGPIEGDNIVNAFEASDGVVMTGTAQSGSTVMVAWNGTTLPATVDANGNWSVTFPSSAVTNGTYSATATVTSTDAFGNTASATRVIQVDTETFVSFNAVQVTDNIVSGAERTSGFQIGGRSEPNARVEVTIEGVTQIATADGSGNWTATFPQGSIREGSYTTDMAVRATDVNGNVATATQSIRVDTVVDPMTVNPLPLGADNIMNATEAANGLTVTGVVEPNSVVTLRLANGTVITANVSANGTWTAQIPANQIPAGESTVPLVITARDAVGNTSTLTQEVQIDTVVRNFARGGGPIGGDGIINAAEADAGVTLTGTVEPNSTLVVRLSNGSEQRVTADGQGNWSVTFSKAQLPTGEGTATVTMTATDPVGNVKTLTETFAYDTVMPSTPEVISFERTRLGLRGIGTELTEDDYSFTMIAADGQQTTISATRTDSALDGETQFRLAQTVPDGSYLVIDTRDDAGNETSTLLIVNNTTAVNVDLSRNGLDGFDFSAIDLSFAPEANLTLSAADLAALTGPERELMVKGDDDDRVRLDDAVNTNLTRVVDGQTYRVFTMGDGTVLVDEDIQTQII